MKNINFDIERIGRRIKEIETRLKYLKQISQVDQAKFLTDHYISSTAERDLEIAIQSCLDIADHIVVKLGLELPKKDRKEIFQILASNKIIPLTSVPKLTAMAGMRNILVHEYLEIEREKVYQTINQDLDDIVIFLKAIQQFLDKRGILF